MISPRSNRAVRAAAPSIADLATRAGHERVRGPVEERDRGHDDGVAGYGAPMGAIRSPDRDLAGEGRDRVEPQVMSSSGVGTKSDTGGLGRSPAGRQHAERTGVAGGRVAAGRLPRMRPAPVDRLIRAMAHRLERQEAPADDPVGDLEPAPDLDGRRLRPSAQTTSYVASGWPVGRTQPTGRAGRSPAVLVRELSEKWATTRWLTGRPGAVGPVGGSTVAGREDPAGAADGAGRARMGAPGRPPDRREPGQGRAVRRVKPPGHVVVGGVPHRRKVDRPGQRRRGLDRGGIIGMTLDSARVDAGRVRDDTVVAIGCARS